MKVKWWQIGLLLCLLVAALSPLASSAPDGLERVAHDQGFMGRATAAPFQLLADYVFPGVANETVATMLSGLIGTLAVFGVVCAVAWLVRSRREPAE